MRLYEVREEALREAEELVGDLRVLVEAGLVATVCDPAGELRYAPAGPEADEAA